ncbi:hypothetical protein BGZ81_009047 [Podila clonocystis]|nr:hypothetical protein BGZ81_009047 [Podila clonocystis]
MFDNNGDDIFNINFHAPANRYHRYFSQHGHLNWSFPAFLSIVAADLEDSIDTPRAALNKWNEDLASLSEAPYIPKVVKNRINELLDQKDLLAPIAHINITFVAKIPKESAIDSSAPHALMSSIVDWSKVTKTSYVNAYGLEISKELSEEAFAVLEKFRLTRPASATLMGYLNTFKQATDWRVMMQLAVEFHNQMALRQAYNQEQEDRYFLRQMYTQAAEKWQRDEIGQDQETNSELRLAHLHHHLNDIFRAIRHVTVRHRDIDSFDTVYSKQYNVVLTFDKAPLDIVIMDIEPTRNRPNLEETEEMAKTMATNLDRTLIQIPLDLQDQHRQALRAFGMMNSNRVKKYVDSLIEMLRVSGSKMA